MTKDPSSSSSASLTNLYTHLQTLIEKWVYGKAEVDNKLSNKLDKAQTSYKGKNVIVDSSSGNIAFEDKNNHTHSQYLTEHQSLANYVLNSSLGSVAFSNDYDDLDNKPTIPTIPTNVSAFNNDSGYLTAHQNISGKEDKSNKVTSLSSSSTDTQYPSAKAVYDAIFSLDTLDCINENFTLLSLPQITLTHNQRSFNGEETRLLTNYSEGAYVDWGDGTPIETYESTDTLKHSYSDSVQEHTITIYGDILNLYNNSFENFISMTSINIPSGVTSLGDNCFNRCSGLTSIIIPSSVTSLGNNCFQSCRSLTNVTIPSSVTNLGNSCFYNCTGLTSVTIPSSVISLGVNCFSACTGLTSVTIQNGVTSLGIGCFYDCTGLTSVTIPNGVTSLGNSCFYNCTGLTSVTIPSSVISLGANCFSACTGLTSVTIQNGVTSLGNSCFYNCTGLTSVTIPSSVTNLGNSCFYKCTNLVDYQLYWETPPVNWSSTRMPNNTDTYFTIPNGTTANYTAKGFPSDKLVERSE